MEEIDTRKGSEARIRRLAHQFGYRVVKSRQRKHVPNLNNHGDYMLIENATNVVAIGERFDASLADIEDFLCPAFDDEAVIRTCVKRRPSPWPGGKSGASSSLNASFLSAASGSSVLRTVWAMS